jgi:alanyl-tRNA synthetase
VKELSSIIGGSGGGPANSATGGGKDAARLGDALEAGARAVREKLGGRG